MRLARIGALSAGILSLFAGGIEANPILQLDMKNGTYDSSTQTIVGSQPGGGAFTLFAILQPKPYWSPADIDTFLNATYYISAAVTPGLGPTHANLGSFSFGQAGTTPTTVNATADMVYGTPPKDVLTGTYNAGDLPVGAPYPTFFTEFTFQFQATNRALGYDSALTPGGPTPDAGGTSYYAVFRGDTSMLGDGYDLHFDLYHAVVKSCGTPGLPACATVTTDFYAPFSNDAETRSVPEPLAMFSMMAGAVTCVAFRRSKGPARQ